MYPQMRISNRIFGRRRFYPIEREIPLQNWGYLPNIPTKSFHTRPNTDSTCIPHYRRS